MDEVFVDTNVLLRMLADDDPDHSPRAAAFFARVARRELLAHITVTVVFETVFTLERRYRRNKAWIREYVLRLIRMRGLLLAEKAAVSRALDLYAAMNLQFGDAWHVVSAQNLGLSTIVSFDRGLDRVPGLTRVEP